MAPTAEPPTTGVVRHDRWRSFGIATAVVVAYAVLVLTTHSALFDGGMTLGGDARTSYWQDVVFAVKSLRAGSAPLWNHFERGGYPFSADPQPAIWSPLSWLVYLLGLVSGDHGHWLQEIRQLAAPVLAACGAHLFLRRRGLSHPAAGLAGTILVAGAFAQRTITMATYWPWAYLGFILAAIDATIERPGWSRGRWLALSLLLLGTSGFPPSIFYALLIAVPYALLRLLHPSGASARALRLRALLAMAGAALVATLGGLVVVVPLLEQTALSWRAERGLDYILSNPASFADLWTLLDPLLPGKQLFVGLLGAAMAALALVELGRRPRRAEVLFWLTIAVSGVLLAAAKETPLLTLCATYLPGFDLFRIASRYMLLTHTGLAFLAAYGLDRALRSAGGRPATRVQSETPGARRPERRRQKIATAVASICLIIQVKDLQRLEIRGRFAKAQDFASGEALAAELGDSRAYNEWTLGPRGGAVFSVRDWRGRSKDPMSFARYQDVEREVPGRPALLRHFAVTHLLVGARREVAGRPRLRRPAAIPGTTLEAPYHFRFAEPGPEVYWSAEIIETPPGKGLAELRRRPVGAVIIVDEGELGDEESDLLAGSAEGPPAAVAGDVIDRRRNRITVEVDAPAAGIVALAEVWHPGWRAEVDGVSAPVHRVNHLLRGVVVGAGHHRIELVYRPRSLPWVAGLYGLAWLIILVDPRVLRRRRRRRTS